MGSTVWIICPPASLATTSFSFSMFNHQSSFCFSSVHSRTLTFIKPYMLLALSIFVFLYALFSFFLFCKFIIGTWYAFSFTLCICLLLPPTSTAGFSFLHLYVYRLFVCQS
ncbi:hypothetical protein BDB00DRAFT_364394 [Zychaea mexicana]|uniref:uncharacterized protein n=1 Tax=Zychaea mexicana TaxID=64656 RepID=UPI0022FE16DD|nr:uncharacterized protein BDB00DRAFT_364394 [Zychaea mexicana]KAI9493518.1 hypothetical protein BDB00DRAFT_364394 [Zychaea mexicana]